jgi:hypothetical protein
MFPAAGDVSQSFASVPQDVRFRRSSPAIECEGEDPGDDVEAGGERRRDHLERRALETAPPLLPRT